MVEETRIPATAVPFALAIDDAISFLDSLIVGFQAPLRPGSAPAAAAVAEAPTECAKREDEVLPSISLKSAQLTNEQQMSGKDSVLNRPGKKPLKTPGVAASMSGMAPKPTAQGASENEENFDKAHVEVGLVQSVADHPVSEKLYICKVMVAGGQVRQVVAGLKRFLTPVDLEGKKVCVILNLKPAKLAGQLSEAMILAGDAQVDGVETVKILDPPSDASIGDRIYLQNRDPSANPAKQLSSKVWEKIVPLLKVEGGSATFDKTPLVTSVGVVKVPHLPDGAGIH